MEMDKWRAMRTRAFAAAEALQAELARVGVPETLWQRIQPFTGRTGRTHIGLGRLTVQEAERLARALAVVPEQRTVPGTSGTDPEVSKHCEWCDADTGLITVGIAHAASGPGRTLYACQRCQTRKRLLPLDQHPPGSLGFPREDYAAKRPAH